MLIVLSMLSALLNRHVENHASYTLALGWGVASIRRRFPNMLEVAEEPHGFASLFRIIIP